MILWLFSATGIMFSPWFVSLIFFSVGMLLLIRLFITRRKKIFPESLIWFNCKLTWPEIALVSKVLRRRKFSCKTIKSKKTKSFPQMFLRGAPQSLCLREQMPYADTVVCQESSFLSFWFLLLASLPFHHRRPPVSWSHTPHSKKLTNPAAGAAY